MRAKQPTITESEWREWKSLRSLASPGPATIHTVYRVAFPALLDEVESLRAENSELKVRDSNVTFHSRNVMAVNQDLAKKLATLEADPIVEELRRPGSSWCPHPEDRREGFALDSQAGELIEVDWCRACGAFREGGDSEDWLYPVTHAALARIKALEGGIVAENRRVVAEHNALRAENAQLNKQLTNVQKRCTELLEERRRAHIDYSVREFHLKHGHPAPVGVAVPPEDRVRFRARLIVEEFLETLEAMLPSPTYSELRDQLNWIVKNAPVQVNMVEFIDGTHDLDYVVAGTRVEFGYDGREGALEVHRANMEKGVDDGTGKPSKPEGWKPPDIEGVLRRQGYRG